MCAERGSGSASTRVPIVRNQQFLKKYFRCLVELKRVLRDHWQVASDRVVLFMGLPEMSAVRALECGTRNEVAYECHLAERHHPWFQPGVFHLCRQIERLIRSSGFCPPTGSFRRKVLSRWRCTMRCEPISDVVRQSVRAPSPRNGEHLKRDASVGNSHTKRGLVGKAKRSSYSRTPHEIAPIGEQRFQDASFQRCVVHQPSRGVVAVFIANFMTFANTGTTMLLCLMGFTLQYNDLN